MIATNKNYLYVGIGALVILVIIALGISFGGKHSVSTSTGQIMITFMGQQIPLVPVNGNDVECIGAPPGYTRVYYDYSSDELVDSTTLGYAKKGEYKDEAIEWFISKAEECGFSKYSESSGSYGHLTGVFMEYHSPDDSKVLTFDVMVVPANDGNKYTLIRIGYDIYKESYGEYTEENTDESSNSGNEYEMQQEVSVTGIAKTWNDYMKPLLEEVYGSVKLILFATSGNNTVGLSYMTPRTITANDMSMISNKFVEYGWNQIMSQIDNSQFILGFQKDNVYLEVYGDIEGNMISVVVSIS